MNEGTHYSVLLRESVDALVTNPDGVYVDGTFGRGGHSREILSRLSEAGRLIGFDKDPLAIEEANRLATEDARFRVVHDSFAALNQVDSGFVDGVLLDLGVSSPQLDDADRGFSFMNDGPLDMRMDNSKGISAAEWVARASEDEMIFVFREYGEERFAKRIARAIIDARNVEPITRTLKFAQIVKDANPRWEKHKHPATRVFQAVRIHINAELTDLQQVLDNAVECLNPKGRMVVISFHSLEDRIVKRFFRRMSQGKVLPRGLPVTEEMLDKRMSLVGKTVKASDFEVDENVRSRSAIMRIAERLG